jgi:peptidoglycan L-alanyl-D-glutamate endopeptidase CwlK
MSYDERSYKNLDGLQPDFKQRVASWYEECGSEGPKILIYCGFRSFEDQEELYKQGRTKAGSIVTNAKGGQSFHNYGRAIDYVPIVRGEVCWDDTAGYLKAQRIGKEFNLRAISWELPHLEDGNFESWRSLAGSASQPPSKPSKALSRPIVERLSAIRKVGGRGIR